MEWSVRRLEEEKRVSGCGSVWELGEQRVKWSWACEQDGS